MTGRRYGSWIDISPEEQQRLSFAAVLARVDEQIADGRVVLAERDAAASFGPVEIRIYRPTEAQGRVCIGWQFKRVEEAA